VSDLIQAVTVDSVFLTYLLSPTGSFWYTQYQYQNAAKVRQQGWEGTASINLGPLALKGTYSWTDSRVLAVNSQYSGSYHRGQTFALVPTHTGNVIASFAHGGASATMTANYMGSVVADNYNNEYTGLLGYGIGASRIQMYLPRKRSVSTVLPQPAYVKTDIAASQRLTPWASFTVNIINLSNSFHGESIYFEPALGRQTSFGISLRTPR